MSSIVNGDLGAVNAQRFPKLDKSIFTKAVEQLSSGLHTDQAENDAADMIVSSDVKAKIRDLREILGNAQNDHSLLRGADTGMQGAQVQLEQIRDLAVQASMDSLSDDERSAIQAEVEAAVQELNSLASDTKFIGRNLLDGTATEVELQVVSSTPNVSFASVDAGDLGVSDLDVSTAEGAAAAIDAADDALEFVSEERSVVEAIHNEVEGIIGRLSVVDKNLSAVESVISDPEIAYQAAQSVKNSMITEFSAGGLTTISISPQQVLEILG